MSHEDGECVNGRLPTWHRKSVRPSLHQSSHGQSFCHRVDNSTDLLGRVGVEKRTKNNNFWAKVRTNTSKIVPMSHARPEVDIIDFNEPMYTA